MLWLKSYLEGLNKCTVLVAAINGTEKESAISLENNENTFGNINSSHSQDLEVPANFHSFSHILRCIFFPWIDVGSIAQL